MIIDPLLLKCFKTVSIIVSMQPIDFIAPPKAKAHITSEIAVSYTHLDVYKRQEELSQYILSKS